LGKEFSNWRSDCWQEAKEAREKDQKVLSSPFSSNILESLERNSYETAPISERTREVIELLVKDSLPKKQKKKVGGVAPQQGHRRKRSLLAPLLKK